MYTTLSNLKTRLGITATGDDGALTATIIAVSAAFDGFCCRKFARSEDAELTWDASARQISLDRYPVESILSISVRQHARAQWIRQQVDYESLGGCVLSLAGDVGDPGEIMRIRWIGGYVLPGTTPEDGQTALPADLEMAALDQAASWWENRHSLRRETLDARGRSTRQPAHTALLEQVEATLERYRRMVA